MRLILFAAFICLGIGSASAASLTLVCLDIGRSLDACRSAAAKFEERTDNTVRVVAADPLGRVSLDRYEALLAVDSPRLDVIQFPDAWGPALAGQLAPLSPLSPDADFLGASRELSVIAGRRIGWPHHVAITMVFFRNDVVGEQLDLWSQLRDRLLQAPSDGAVGLSLGGADPALFPFFLDWFYGLGGTSIDDRDALARTLSMLDSLLGSVATAGVTKTRMSEAASAFASGDAAALLTRSVQAPVISGSEFSAEVAPPTRPGFTEAPADAPVLATTWYLGVSRHSSALPEAKALAAFLASEEIQRENALRFGLAPTRRALLADDEIGAARPSIGKIAASADRLTALPVRRFGIAYLDVVDQSADSIRRLLRGEIQPDAAASAIARSVRRADRTRN